MKLRLTCRKVFLQQEKATGLSLKKSYKNIIVKIRNKNVTFLPFSDDFCSHTNIFCYSKFDLNYILYHHIWIYIHIIPVWLIFLIFFFFFFFLKNLKFCILFGTQILSDISLRVLQLPLHLSKVIIEEEYLCLTGFRLKRKFIDLCCLLFNGIHLVTKDPLKLNHPINIFFNKLKHYFILYFFMKYL